MNIHVLPTGAVGQVIVTGSSGYDILDDAAVKAARAWIYQPATRGGRPIAYTLAQTVTFKIRDGRR